SSCNRRGRVLRSQASPTCEPPTVSSCDKHERTRGEHVTRRQRHEGSDGAAPACGVGIFSLEEKVMRPVAISGTPDGLGNVAVSVSVLGVVFRAGLLWYLSKK